MASYKLAPPVALAAVTVDVVVVVVVLAVVLAVVLLVVLAGVGVAAVRLEQGVGV